MPKKFLPLLLALLLSLGACRKDTPPPAEPAPPPAPWVQVPLPLRLYRGVQLTFWDAHTGWFCGNTEQLSITHLLRTTDGGQSWQAINLAPLRLGFFRAFFALNARELFVCADDWDAAPGTVGRPLYRSHDGGLSWQKMASTNFGGAFALHFFSDQVGVSTNSGTLQRTTDGGQSWQTMYEAPGGTNRLTFPSPGVGYAYGGVTHDGLDQGTLLITHDQGQSWQTLRWPYGAIALLSFVSEPTGFAVTAYGRVYKTQDGGRSWQQQTDKGPGCESGRFFDAQRGYVLGGQAIWQTQDGGKSWQLQHTLTERVFNSIAFPTPTTAYALTSDGQLLRSPAP